MSISKRKWLALGAVLAVLFSGCAANDTPTSEPTSQPTETTVPPTTAVPDTTPPVIEGVADLRCYLGHNVDLLKGISCFDDMDESPELTVDDSHVDWTAPGSYIVTYTASDDSGNESSATAVLTIIEDNTPPVIYGATDRSLCVGGTIAYRQGVLLTDDTDDSPKLSVDSSGVDLSTPGIYPLVYSATDAAGNVATVEVTVTVHEKLYYFVDEEVIWAKADEIIAEIITEDMTQEEQVWAIYYWIRANYSFNGWADKVDWKQNAYDMIRTGKSDCYGFFALSKLLFERLGIPNVDVERVRTWEHNGNHYWSVVSVDGGKTWYHYDSTPFLAGDVMCLVTDATLDEFSARNWNCYNRDRSTYPATP